jgi:hypothetical protein
MQDVTLFSLNITVETEE